MTTVSSRPRTHSSQSGVTDAIRTVGLLRRLLACAALAIALGVGAPSTASADFAGSYALDNWTFLNANADGSVVPSTGTAASIVITGGNNSSFALGTTDLTIAAAAAGTVSFAWSYFSLDSNTFDLAGFCKPIGSNPDPCFVNTGDVTDISDNLVLLATNAESGASGTVSETVAAGDIFGFRVLTADNFAGPGVLTISDFSAPEPAGGGQENEVPAPPALALLAMGLAVAGLARLERRPSR